MDRMQRVRCAAVAARRLVGCLLAGAALALSPVAAQEAAPKKHDNAEARQLLAQAEQVAEKMTDREMQIAALENIGVAKALARDYEGARVIARRLGTDVSKEKILRDVAITQALAGDTDEGWKTVGGIRAAEGKVLTCFMMARELARAGRKKEALHVLDQAVDSILPKVTPGFETMNAMLSLGGAYAIAGAPTVTSKFADLFKGDPRLVEISTAMLVIAKAYNHDLTGAKQKYAQLHTCESQIMALGAIVDVQVRSGDKPGVADTWKQMTEVVQTKPLKISRILGLVLVQEEAGDLAAARATIALALHSVAGEDDSALSRIASLQADGGDVEGALKTLARIKSVTEQANARYAIASARAKAGDAAGALATAPPDADPWCQTQVLVGAARGILESLKPSGKP